MRQFVNIGTLFVALTVGAAVYAARTGKPSGKFLGIPYEFRVPTINRVRERLWNKDDDRIFVPMLFGVGWAINFYRAVEKFRTDNAVDENDKSQSHTQSPDSEVVRIGNP